MTIDWKGCAWIALGLIVVGAVVGFAAYGLAKALGA